jgi:sugar phosphate isomerase/epimerase
VKLGVLLAGKRPEDIAKRLEQAREAGFSLCQLNFMQTGLSRAELLAIVDAMLEFGIRPAAVGCYINPLRPDDTFMGVNRGDLEMILHSLDIIGARKIVLWSGTNAATVYEDHPANNSPDSIHLLRSFITDTVRETRARHYYLVIEAHKCHVLRDEKSMVEFHQSLAPDVAERVRFVLDAPNLITPERYDNKNTAAEWICRAVGPLAGVAHLKDCIMPPDGDESLAAPGQGKLDYPSYVGAIIENCHRDAPAIVKNVPSPEYATVRDYLLQLSDRWELT